MSSRRRPKASTSRLPDVVPPVVASTRTLRARPTIKKSTGPFVDAVEIQDSGEEWRPTDSEAEAPTRSEKAKGKAKRVRIASQSSSDRDEPAQEDFVSLSPSPGATGRKSLEGADDSDSDTPVQSDDYWDPRLLPVHQNQRRTRELRKLEYGGYKTALYDAARGDMDLGVTLMDWEAIKRREEAEEVDAEGEGRTRVERLTRQGRRGSRSRGGTPMTASEPEGTPGPLDIGIGGNEILPFPSALSLDILSRWPLHRAVQDVDHDLGEDQEQLNDQLWALLLSTKTKLERLTPALRRPHPRPPRPRSAYELGGPLASLPDTSTTNGDAAYAPSDDDDSSDTSDLNPADDDAPIPSLQPSFDILASSLDTLLGSLLDEVPAGPPPSLDYYQQQNLWRKGKPRPADRAVGWEEVLKCVKRMAGVPSNVAEQLEDRLIGAFGPPRPATPSASAEEKAEPASPSTPADSASPPPKAKGKQRAKIAGSSTTRKAKRKAGEGAQAPAKRRRGSRPPAAPGSPADLPAFAPIPDLGDLSGPQPQIDLPPLPELPPPSVLEEFRKGV